MRRLRRPGEIPPGTTRTALGLAEGSSNSPRIKSGDQFLRRALYDRHSAGRGGSGLFSLDSRYPAAKPIQRRHRPAPAYLSELPNRVSLSLPGARPAQKQGPCLPRALRSLDPPPPLRTSLACNRSAAELDAGQIKPNWSPFCGVARHGLRQTPRLSGGRQGQLLGPGETPPELVLLPSRRAALSRGYGCLAATAPVTGHPPWEKVAPFFRADLAARSAGSIIYSHYSNLSQLLPIIVPSMQRSRD